MSSNDLVYTMGSDPEVFFTSGNPPVVLPAAVVYKGIQVSEPINMATGDIIADGAAMEFQPQAALSPKELLANLQPLIARGNDMCNSYIAANTRQGREAPNVSFWPELPIDLSWCKEDPELAVFGCDPDKSAWGEGCEPGNIDASKHPWRYAGCHIHIGVLGDPNHFRKTEVMHENIKALDRTVGLASMIISDGNDTRRRAIYGRPGIYRHQPHGLEYRTPSNMILRSPKWLEFIFDLTLATVKLVHDGAARELTSVVPDESLLLTLRDGYLDIAKDHYSRVSTAFGLPELPDIIPVNWRVEWLA